jgi:hypothetical protein
MRNAISILVAASLIASTLTPALAAPTIVVQLGSAPLLGVSTSSKELRHRMEGNDGRMATAATMLGLSPSEYSAFRVALSAKTPAWGVLPRHLDAMAFYRPDGVHVLHDVIIPSRTYGWEVDVDESGQTVRVLIPATCGNLSIIRRFHPAVAARAVAPPTRVAASVERSAPTAAPQAATAPAPEAVPSPSSTPAVEASPVPAAVAETPQITPPQGPPSTTHRFPWLWLFPVALLLFSGSGSGARSHPVAGGGGGCGCGCQ